MTINQLSGGDSTTSFVSADPTKRSEYQRNNLERRDWCFTGWTAKTLHVPHVQKIII